MTLIDQGFQLMLYGMGTVFVFLTILVFATMLMSSLLSRFSDEDENPDTSDTTSTIAIQPQVLEAIKQAIHQHRQARYS